MMLDPDDLVFLDMKVEEAFKYIISCGVIMTPFVKVPRDQTHQENNPDTISSLDD